MGSSPRRRGAGRTWFRQSAGLGFIPAQAGSSAGLRPTRPARGVHPRAGGEQSRPMSCVSWSSGSSPRRRGAVAEHPDLAELDGFIPTQAGSSRSARGSSGSPRVHPHAGGEQTIYAVLALPNVGSSPRRRGAVSQDLAQRISAGFIPTQAGSRSVPPGGRCRSGVHPHAGGEQLPLARPVIFWLGSSPRRRGAVESVDGLLVRSGFIPTQAGSRCRSRLRRRSGRVHPHAGGEQACASPRVPG